MPGEYPGVPSYARKRRKFTPWKVKIVSYFLACATEDGVQLKKTLDDENPGIEHMIPQRRKLADFPATVIRLVRLIV